jgi:hypothetical protein
MWQLDGRFRLLDVATAKCTKNCGIMDTLLSSGQSGLMGGGSEPQRIRMGASIAVHERGLPDVYTHQVHFVKAVTMCMVDVNVKAMSYALPEQF